MSEPKGDKVVYFSARHGHSEDPPQAGTKLVLSEVEGNLAHRGAHRIQDDPRFFSAFGGPE